MNTVKSFTFRDLESQLLNDFKRWDKQQVFYVEIDRDEIWDCYINGFEEASRQEHNCNCCKSFLRQYGGLVSIKDNKLVSIWDNLEVSSEYRKSVDNLRTYIHSRPITDIFLSNTAKCGTKSNLDRKRSIIWEHFFLELPSNLVNKNIGPSQSTARDNKNVLKRSLDELTIDSTETILELIAQNSLYRGKESEALLKEFLKLQKTYKELPEVDKDNFCWSQSTKSSSAINRIRNTAIGTLLIDLSEGVELDTAVTKFEKVVAPSNYKRPSALTTPKMVEQAKDKLKELGLLESLNRRYANETDIKVSDILFKDTPSNLLDVFDQISKDTVVNPRSFSKVEEIGIEDFIKNIVPAAKSISVLVENSHLNNFVSLIAPQDIESPTLFKWGNNFSWDYTGGVTDSIKERVKAAGGNVVGELRTSLSWFNYDDLDIHVTEPDGKEIFYGNRTSVASGGTLDVDMNAREGRTRSPVENIIWTNKSKMIEGVYTVSVHNYSKRETKDGGFEVQIECNGQIFDFEFKESPRDSGTIKVAEFTYSKTDGLSFKGEVKSNVVSKDKWGIKTNQFHKVTKLLLSPNHWSNNIGNKHYLFMLEGCISDEDSRPFFNEFLKQELDPHRKVFEILGGKIKLEKTNNQLSGLGFSETKRASMIVKVTGNFTRTLKVNF